jgi:hypothetical protein
VIFVYGSMVWGIFPYRPDMSFESHLMGLIVGAVLAVHYRHEGPQPTLLMKDIEEKEEDDEEEQEEGVEAEWKKDSLYPEFDTTRNISYI